MAKGRIPKMDYNYQDLGYSEPFKTKNGNMTRPQLFYRHQKLYIDFIEGIQKLFLPYSGKEKKCFECGGSRELVLELDLNGKYLGQHEVCDK